MEIWPLVLWKHPARVAEEEEDHDRGLAVIYRQRVTLVPFSRPPGAFPPLWDFCSPLYRKPGRNEIFAWVSSVGG